MRLLAGIALLFVITTSVMSEEPPSFGSQDIEKLLEKMPNPSLEALLPQLPLELRRNFTFMTKSGSEQGATPENPRVILFGEDAKLILAYSSDPKAKGGDRLEMIEWDSKTKRPVFRELVFSGAQGGQKYRMSHANPESCKECHGSKPSWIWDQYNEWPGAAGALDDGIYSSFPEGKRYVEWLTRKDQNPRLKPLELEKGNPAAPYYESRHQKEDGEYIDGGDAKRALEIFNELSKNRVLRRMPNTRLTSLVTRLNGQRLLSYAQESPYFERYAPLLLFFAMGCSEGTIKSEGGQTARSAFQDTPALRQALARDARDYSGPLPEGDLETFTLLLRALGFKGIRDVFTGTMKSGYARRYHDHKRKFDDPNKILDGFEFADGEVGGSGALLYLRGPLWEAVARRYELIKLHPPKPRKAASDTTDSLLYDARHTKALAGIGTAYWDYDSGACEALKEKVIESLATPVKAAPIRSTGTPTHR